MEFLTGIFALIASFLAGFFGHVLAHDFCEFTPRMCRRLIERAASLLPERDRARYTEEWLSHLSDCPGTLKKFRHAADCVLIARRLGRIRSVETPPFKTLRIEFGGLGYVELDCATSMVLITFCTLVGDGWVKLRKQNSVGIRILGLLGSRNIARIIVLWTIKSLAAACIRHRKLGQINPNQTNRLVSLLRIAVKNKNADLKIYRDGAELDVSQLRKLLEDLKAAHGHRAANQIT
jgi:hypothetical protein